MNSRQRVLKVLNHEIPDRVPVWEVLVDKPMVKEVLGIDDRISRDLSPEGVAENPREPIPSPKGSSKMLVVA